MQHITHNHKLSISVDPYNTLKRFPFTFTQVRSNPALYPEPSLVYVFFRAFGGTTFITDININTPRIHNFHAAANYGFLIYSNSCLTRWYPFFSRSSRPLCRFALASSNLAGSIFPNEHRK